jgi:hypothetical protein
MIQKQMEKEKNNGLIRIAKIRITKNGERAFFFYATIGMVILWAATRIWGG